MKKLYSVVCILLISIIFFSCRDDYNYDLASQPLRFSKDTLLLDTVFSENRSNTYVLKVYNQQNEDVTIPRIYLEKNLDSQFKINVDGVSGGNANNNNFQNVSLRAHDSLYIFIELAPKTITSPTALVDENLIFETVGNIQKVKLISLVENADFYFSTSGTKEIKSDLIWDSSKSKVIYGNLKFVNGSKLTINKGTKVYLHKNAALIIDKGCQLIINGTLNEKVLIRGDRHDIEHDTLPANWNKIHLMENTKANINYAIIKGGNQGLFLEKNSELNIFNSQILNFMDAGIHSLKGSIKGENIVMNDCGKSDLIIENGGNYDFTHCTFSNYWNLNLSPGYAVYLSNYYSDKGSLSYNPLNIIFKNCILWTRNSNSLFLDINKNAAFNYTFDTNLIRNNSDKITIQGNPNFKDIIVNQNPLFYKTGYNNPKLNLKPASPAIGKGNLTYSIAIPKDINGVSRTINPNLGAYQK